MPEFLVDIKEDETRIKSLIAKTFPGINIKKTDDRKGFLLQTADFCPATVTQKLKNAGLTYVWKA